MGSELERELSFTKNNLFTCLANGNLKIPLQRFLSLHGKVFCHQSSLCNFSFQPSHYLDNFCVKLTFKLAKGKVFTGI